MVGTRRVEELVQSVALSHLVKDFKRVSLLLLAAPESGKTTIMKAANAKHVCRIAMITGRSILKEVNDHPKVEFLLFNDLTAIRAMSAAAVNLIIVLLNQLTQDEHGVVAFAGKETEHITRSIGIIGCLPFDTFRDHRAKWKELGFVSRMLPFAYTYPADLVAQIKDTVDAGTQLHKSQPTRKMPSVRRRPTVITCGAVLTRRIRAIADARAFELKQPGIRLLQNYHALTRAHALLFGRDTVTDDDLDFLRWVDRFVSIQKCEPIEDDKPSAGTIRRPRQRVTIRAERQHSHHGEEIEGTRLGG